MKRPWITPLAAAESQRRAIATAVPVLKTERLILRAPIAEDWTVLAPIWRTDRARFIGGPYNEEDAWLDFSQAVASWVLRGVGYWTVTHKSDATILGFAGLGQETADPELEFGWLLTEQAEGHGYALEATQAIRTYAFDTLGLKTLISFVDRKNHRSVALAEKLGARLDQAAVPHAFKDEDFAFRHDPETVT